MTPSHPNDKINILFFVLERQTDRQTDRQTNGSTDRPSGRPKPHTDVLSIVAQVYKKANKQIFSCSFSVDILFWCIGFSLVISQG